MINVEGALRDMPHSETFCSVDKLHALVERLRADSRFKIDAAGTSVKGEPIYHVCFGTGSLKALIVAGPHAHEPIGSLTVLSLMTLLHEGSRALLDADVQWHIVPCIDPDGARLNEGWSQQPFTLENYMRNLYLQAPRDQVDGSFPITYKKMVWKQPSHEAKILQRILDQIRPDFYFPLHNYRTGGAFYYITRDIDHKYYREIHELLERHDFPLQRRPLFKEVCPQFGEGIVGILTIKKYYDYLEQTTSSPEGLVQGGTQSWDYLANIKPSALTFVAEMGYVRHPSDESERQTGQNLRKLQLRLDADNKFLATLLLEEWEKVKEDLDTESPFYQAIVRGGTILPDKAKISDGGIPLSRYATRDILFNPHNNRTMTEGDQFSACMVDGGFWFPLWSYQFVRLLKESPPTPAVRQAIERLERAYDDALDDIARYIDFHAFESFDCDTLAKVQLGSGLIVLNSLLETQKGGQ